MGLYTTGLPTLASLAGGTLTGNETAPFDTYLPEGQSPQTVQVSSLQLANYVSSAFTGPITILQGGTGATSVLTTQNNLSIRRGFTINSVGDSLSAISSYQPLILPSYAAAPPQWTANTVYVTGNVVVNNGLNYYVTTGGTSGTTGPTGKGGGISDGTVTWHYNPPYAEKSPRELLFWVEAYALGELVWNQAQGYGGSYRGLVKVVVQNGGSGYSTSDTVTFTGGAKGTLTVSNGVITACTVTNPGYTNNNGITATINTSTGSGAVLTVIQNSAGTFGIAGAKTADIVAILPDIIASTVDIFIVMIGTNDVVNNVPYATVVANLKTIYENNCKCWKNSSCYSYFPKRHFNYHCGSRP